MKAGLKTRIRPSQSGQTLLELALLLPLFLMLLMGIFDVGRYMYMYIQVGNAARAGAAFGTQSIAQASDPQNICNAASDDFQGSAVACTMISAQTYQSAGNNGTINVTSSSSSVCDNGSGTTQLNCAAGHWVVTLQVQAQGTFNALFGFPGIPRSITVTDTATMRVAPIG